MATARERSFIKVDDRIHEMWSEDERKFALYLLLKDYAEELDKIIQKTPDPNNVKDAYALQMMARHKNVAQEMIYVLSAELF